jgi:hypothetical protein
VTNHEVGEARITSSFRVVDFSGKTRKEIGVNAAHRNNADPTIITIPPTPTELTSTALFLHLNRQAAPAPDPRPSPESSAASGSFMAGRASCPEVSD